MFDQIYSHRLDYNMYMCSVKGWAQLHFCCYISSTVMHQVIANLIRVFLEGVAALPGAGIPDLYCFVTRPASVSIAL